MTPVSPAGEQRGGGVPELPDLLVQDAVGAALAEDIGLAGDLTTNAIVDAGARLTGEIRARAAGVIAGLQLAEAAFVRLDTGVQFTRAVQDGERVASGELVATVDGPARAILTGERVALNFLIHMSGIASQTRRFVDAVAGTRAAICCTRKTLPGLRAVQKYAVRAGGGMNHRFRLDDGVLIKDNHIACAGGLARAIQSARRQVGHMVKIEVEVDTLDQLREALEQRIDAVLLDNMTPEVLAEAVAMVEGRVITEASGTVNLDSVRGIAESGVDMISVGGLTHSAAALDLGLDFAAS